MMIVGEWNASEEILCRSEIVIMKHEFLLETDEGVL